MYPKGLQRVGNGVSLLPWRKITGTCFTPPWSPPKPMTGTPRDRSMMRGKSAGNVVPTLPLGCGSAARAALTVYRATRTALPTGIIDRIGFSLRDGFARGESCPAGPQLPSSRAIPFRTLKSRALPHRRRLPPQHHREPRGAERSAQDTNPDPPPRRIGHRPRVRAQRSPREVRDHVDGVHPAGRFRAQGEDPGLVGDLVGLGPEVEQHHGGGDAEQVTPGRGEDGEA